MRNESLLCVAVGACATIAFAAPMEPPSATSPAAPSVAPKTPGTTKDAGHDLISPACAQPHPLITEVLYAVPSTGESDANKDGKREVSGDEFVELVNPHDHSIDLRGYTITDGSPNPKSQVHFTFPEMLLPAHAVVVVFNGHDSKIPGPVGDAKHAPAGVNDQFAKAAVFSMRISSARVSFSNAGDAVCLKAPDGKMLQRIRWGKADEKAGGTGFVIDEIAPLTAKGSVQRDGVGKDAAWKAHAEIDSTPFSPGVFSVTGAPTPATATPAPATPATTAPASTTPAATPAGSGAATDPATTTNIVVHRSHRSHRTKPMTPPKF
jgi:hypothetical protein